MCSHDDGLGHEIGWSCLGHVPGCKMNMNAQDKHFLKSQPSKKECEKGFGQCVCCQVPG